MRFKRWFFPKVLSGIYGFVVLQIERAHLETYGPILIQGSWNKIIDINEQ